MQDVTPEIITGTAAALLSLLFAVWRPARQRFDQLTADQQVIARGVVVVLLSFGAAGFGCQLASVAACLNNDLARYGVDVLLSVVLGLKASDGAFSVARFWLARFSNGPTTRGLAQDGAGRPKLL